MALIPTLWLGASGRHLGPEWWWLSGAFLVAWVADTLANWANPWIASPLYLVSQGAIIGLVLLSRREALLLILTLTVTAIVAVTTQGVAGPDVLLHTVAWLSVVGIVYELPQLKRLRTALLVYFGIGWISWVCYAIEPDWPTWGTYQIVRLLGIALFCWASLSPTPHLKLSKR